MSGAPAKRRRLDSDDDDDEYLQPRRDSPLLSYAVTSALPTDEVLLSRTAEGEGANMEAEAPHNVLDHAVEGTGIDAKDAAHAGLPSRSLASSAAVSAHPAFFEEDEDVPAEYRRLFSTEMLNTLLVPLDYICKQKTMTDKLLAQYLPQRAAEAGVSDGVADTQEYRNKYGIKPGFRWDGVVRGRGHVD